MTSSPLRRWRLRLLLASLASLALLAGCAAPAAPAAPALPPPASAEPAPYSLSLRYEPELSLHLQRRGEPFDGEARLIISPRPAYPGAPARAPLSLSVSFSGGVGAIRHDKLAFIPDNHGLSLVVGGDTLELPSGEGNIFQCGSSIEALRKVVACEQEPPARELRPPHCDAEGAQAWLRVQGALEEKSRACWAAADDETLARLEAIPRGERSALPCKRVMALVGDNPPEDVAMRMVETCAGQFPAALRKRLIDRKNLRSLGERRAAAQRGSSLEMHRFYRDYIEIAPKEAKEIRKLAAGRFAFADAKRWRTVQIFVEGQSKAPWSVALCNIWEHGADVELRNRRTSALGPYPPGAPRVGLAPAGGARGPNLGFLEEPSREEMANSEYLDRIREALRVGYKIPSVLFVPSCPEGGQWFLRADPR